MNCKGNYDLTLRECQTVLDRLDMESWHTDVTIIFSSEFLAIFSMSALSWSQVDTTSPVKKGMISCIKLCFCEGKFFPQSLPTLKPNWSVLVISHVVAASLPSGQWLACSASKRGDGLCQERWRGVRVVSAEWPAKGCHDSSLSRGKLIVHWLTLGLRGWELYFFSPVGCTLTLMSVPVFSPCVCCIFLASPSSNFNGHKSSYSLKHFRHFNIDETFFELQTLDKLRNPLNGRDITSH